MTAFVGYSSALEFWRQVDYPETYLSAAALSASPACRNADKSWSLPDRSLLESRGLSSCPITLVADTADARHPSKQVAFRVCRRLPRKSFVEISPGLSVSTPEACFFQMASLLSVTELVALACELCGTYTLDANDLWGFRARDAITSSADLKRFVDAMKGEHGFKKASKALKYAIDGSASPMETILFMLLCLPGSMGGYGLPRPLMNYRVEIPNASRKVTDRAYYVCDFFWPKAKLALEYDSDMFHTGSERIARDSKRRNALEAMGIRVVSATKQQVYDAVELERLACILSRCLGRYRGSAVRDVESRRRALRQVLFQR